MSYILRPSRFGAADPVPDFVGHWAFEEGTGSLVADSSSNGLDGTGVNLGWSGGIVGTNAGDFDATAYVNVPDNSLLDAGTGDFTVCFWFNADSVVSGALFTKDNFPGSGSGLYIYLLSSRVRYWNGSSGTSFTGVLSNATDYFVVVSRSGTTITTYLNDVSQTGATDSRTLSNSHPLRFGAWADLGGTEFDGRMDDARYYDRVLNGTERTALYDLGA